MRRSRRGRSMTIGYFGDLEHKRVGVVIEITPSLDETLESVYDEMSRKLLNSASHEQLGSAGR